MQEDIRSEVAVGDDPAINRDVIVDAFLLGQERGRNVMLELDRVFLVGSPLLGSEKALTHTGLWVVLQLNVRMNIDLRSMMGLIIRVAPRNGACMAFKLVR